MKKHYTIPVFVPELACPHRCIFCNQNHITSKEHAPTLQETKTIIDEHLKTLPKESEIDIGYLGGNFTGISKEQQKAFLQLAWKYKENNQVQGIRVSTRPDYISPEILDLLAHYGVTTVEIGAQSMDEEVLKKAGRGHTVKETETAAEMITNRNFSLGLQMMIGLPQDSDEKSIFTARRIVELGAASTRIYPTLVVRNTPLEEMWLKGQYSPLTMEQAIERTRKIIPIFEEGKVNIIRIGLHPSEGFLNGSQLLAGPFHQSFRELVMTEVWNEKFRNHDWKTTGQQLKIFVHPTDFNMAVGHKAKNTKFLSTQFQRVKFRKDNSISKGTFYVDYS